MAGIAAWSAAWLACAAMVYGQARPGNWVPLFDGKSLGKWRETNFSGHGKTRVENDGIVLGAGGPLTGVTWSGEFPKTNYEIRWEAARIDGNDFFASLTFPVGNSYCTWVTGGWGGDIVGLSSLDGWDASDNETRSYFDFDKGRWYAFRLKVTPERITGWIDDRQIVDAAIAGRTVGLRFGEIKLSAPLGFASYGTAGGIRKIEYRALPV
jgi:Domain of Unknown Function (DUF1080)